MGCMGWGEATWSQVQIFGAAELLDLAARPDQADAAMSSVRATMHRASEQGAGGDQDATPLSSAGSARTGDLGPQQGPMVPCGKKASASMAIQCVPANLAANMYMTPSNSGITEERADTSVAIAAEQTG